MKVCDVSYRAEARRSRQDSLTEPLRCRNRRLWSDPFPLQFVSFDDTAYGAEILGAEYGLIRLQLEALKMDGAFAARQLDAPY